MFAVRFLLFFQVTGVYCQGIIWKTVINGTLPPHAFPGGTRRDRREDTLFICKRDYNNHEVCGKTSQKTNVCIITYVDRAIDYPAPYQVLTLPLWVPYTLRWVKGYSYGKVPPNAVEGGDMVYVGRFLNGSEVILGKVDSINQAFFYDKDGVNEAWLKEGYDVLVKEEF